MAFERRYTGLGELRTFVAAATKPPLKPEDPAMRKAAEDIHAQFKVGAAWRT